MTTHETPNRAPTDAPPPPTDLMNTAPEASHNYWMLGLLFLLLCGILNCFVGLGKSAALGDHECINALGARQCIRSGEWLIPHVGEVPWIRKPPLGIWLIGGASYLVDKVDAAEPVSEYAARFPSAVAGLANAFAVCWLGWMMYGRRAGLVAGLIAAGCVATVFGARNAQVDMVLTLLTTLTFACFWRGAMHSKPSKVFMAAFYVALAAAMMAKAPLPLAVTGVSLAVYWLVVLPVLALTEEPKPTPRRPAGGLASAIGQQFRRLPVLWIIPGTILFLVLAGAWPTYVYARVEHALSLWRIEYLDRFSGDMSERSKPFLYYVPILFGLTAPFMLSLPEAMAATFLGRYRDYRKGLAFAFTWAVAGTLLLSVSSFKRPHYLLSVIPAYCLLLAPVIDRLFFGASLVRARRVRVICAILPVFLAAGFCAGGIVLRKEYPELMSSYIVTAILCWTLWTWAGVAYARGQRTLSFAQLNLGVPLILLIMWPAIDRHVTMNPQADALVAALRAHGVTPQDEVVSVDRRPDSSIEYYSGLQIRRLVNEIEMAGLSEGRGKMSMDLYMAFAERIAAELAQDQPVYLILSASYFDMLGRSTDIRPKVLFRLEGFGKKPGDNLVVITQERPRRPPAASAPVERPDAPSRSRPRQAG